MSTPANHWKLGLFVVVGFCLAAATVVFLGARSLKKDTVTYKTFFDESVQGLEIGSPVKFRGVTIGNVSTIRVAPDHRHVEVAYELDIKDLHGLGLSDPKRLGRHTRMVVPADLRIQLDTAGITGVKFLLIDYFSPQLYPPPILPFPTPENYIPATPSLIKNLEDSLIHALEHLPEVARQIQKLLPAVLSTLASVDVLLSDGHKLLSQVDAGKLTGEAQSVMANLNVTVLKINRLVDQVSSDKGLVHSIQRTADAVGTTAANASHVGPALEETLREVQGAAESVRRLADSIDRDPDMLLKGRAKRKQP
ncbi:MAG TPA: MlaD family protein [Pseudomonadota bacterium]|nr:MlaD family protein [Pseudomonadota bacterium]